MESRQPIDGRANRLRTIRSTHASRFDPPMTTVRRWLSDPRAMMDLFVVAIVATLAVIDTASASSEDIAGRRAADGFAYALVIVASVGLAWRRRSPILALAVVSTGIL